MKSNLIRKHYPLYLATPLLVVFIVFYFGSIVASFGLSFTNWSIYKSEGFTFSGLSNFQILFSSENFLLALRNVGLFNIGTTIFKSLFGLGLAILLNRAFKGRNFFRALFYLPCILSPLIIGYIFKFVLHPDGLLNNVLNGIGLKFLTTNWFGDVGTALFSVGIVEVWTWSGFCAVIILAGMQSIPTEILEAARIDGANSRQIFRYITLPYIMPAFSIQLVLNIIGGFKVFDLVMATTNGGPGYETEVLSTLVYKAQAQGLFGYASSIGLIQFLIIAVITIPIIIYLKKREEVQWG